MSDTMRLPERLRSGEDRQMRGIDNPRPAQLRPTDTGRVVLPPLPERPLRTGLSRKTKAVLAGTAVLALAGVAADKYTPIVDNLELGIRKGVAQFIGENVPAIQEAIDDITGRTPPISETFDPSQKQITIKSGVNTQHVDGNSLLAASSQKDSQTRLFFPVILGDGDEVKSATRERIVGVGTMQGDDPATYQRTGTESMFLGHDLVIKKRGTEIMVPPDKKDLRVFRVGKPTSINGKDIYPWVVVRWQENGEYFVLSFNWNDDARQISLKENVADAPIVPMTPADLKGLWTPLSQDSNGKPIDSGAIALETNFRNARVNVRLNASPSDGSSTAGRRVKFGWTTVAGQDGHQKLALNYN